MSQRHRREQPGLRNSMTNTRTGMWRRWDSRHLNCRSHGWVIRTPPCLYPRSLVLTKFCLTIRKSLKSDHACPSVYHCLISPESALMPFSWTLCLFFGSFYAVLHINSSKDITKYKAAPFTPSSKNLYCSSLPTGKSPNSLPEFFPWSGSQGVWIQSLLMFALNLPGFQSLCP